MYPGGSDNFALAQSQYDHAEPDDEWADDEDDGPDPDDVRDRQIERETERAMNSFEQEREE